MEILFVTSHDTVIEAQFDVIQTLVWNFFFDALVGSFLQFLSTDIHVSEIKDLKDRIPIIFSLKWIGFRI
jgi:hypothetical protein